ncbi:hypothetical protein [Spirillospora sp. CA-128828]|uniref:hypothetical protein n=1 Tax=Spirillospora sp. CA-128828 TaxID=3240033 RepID=UPI003D8BC516
MNMRGFLTADAASWRRRGREIGAVVVGLVTTGLGLWRRYRRDIGAVVAGLTCGALIGGCFAVMPAIAYVTRLGFRYGTEGMWLAIGDIDFDVLGVYAVRYVILGAIVGVLSAVGVRVATRLAGEASKTIVRLVAGTGVCGAVVVVVAAFDFVRIDHQITTSAIGLACSFGGFLAAVRAGRR